MNEVSAGNWLEYHRELLNSGFVRFEYLTAVHLEDDLFEVFSKVSSADVLTSTLVKTTTSGSIQSIIETYRAARFHEQETKQMFGLNFIGHEQIERAFATDFAGFPLRKDFSLPKRTEKVWPGSTEPDEKAKRRPALPPGVFADWITE